MKSAVVVSEAPRLNYMHNYVVLPYYYPDEKYFCRKDVIAIRQTVGDNLSKLDEQTGWKEKFRGRRVVVKPNLVALMHKFGFYLDDIPQTTDPRVFEAIIWQLSLLDCDITIAEGAGKGVSTMQYFRDIGIDKIAKRYGCKLVAIEEQPLDHYYVPKAEVQKDVYIPRIFSDVIKGDALYVSVPKTKTNLYTGVTLGFKNAMGTLSGNMRYRNHTWQIEKKLVDLLYLFKPDLTVIDGIIGGEGHTPAPVDPVKFGVIISGTNSVEVDRVASRMMGFDPEEIPLMKEAKSRGFGDENTVVIGEQKQEHFRRAESSFMTPRFKKNWPNVKLLVGFTNDRAPKIDDPANATPEFVLNMEAVCRGGCLASMSMFMEMLNKAKHPVRREKVKMACIIGDGCEIGGRRYWFDSEGKTYDLDGLKTLKKEYKRVLGCGACSRNAWEACTIKAEGCHNMGEYIPKMFFASHALPPVLSWDNEATDSMLIGMIRKWFAIRKLIKQGEMVDIPFDAYSDKVFPIPQLSDDDMTKDWIFVPMEKLNREQIQKALRANKMISIG